MVVDIFGFDERRGERGWEYCGGEEAVGLVGRELKRGVGVGCRVISIHLGL